MADILEHAGRSRDAFYRHFASKEDLVAAIVEAGTWRLAGYVDHRMQKVSTAEQRVRAWIEWIMSQALDPEVARTTQAVLWNGGHLSDPSDTFDSHGVLTRLLVTPLTELPSVDPPRDAAVIGHAVINQLNFALERSSISSRQDVEHLVDFCLRGLHATTAAVGSRPAGLRRTASRAAARKKTS